MNEDNTITIWEQIHNYMGNFLWGDLIALLAFVVGIVTFIYQMKRSREEQSNHIKMSQAEQTTRQKETWYLEIIVKPKLDALNKFYKELTNKMCDIVEDFQSRESTTTIEQLRIEKRNSITKLFNYVSDELDPLVVLVKSYSIALGNKVSNAEIYLQDQISDILNKYDEYDSDRIKREILEQNQIMIMILNEGMSISNEV